MGCPEPTPSAADEAYTNLAIEHSNTVLRFNIVAGALEDTDKLAFYRAMAEAYERNLQPAMEDNARLRYQVGRLTRGIDGLMTDIIAFMDGCKRDKVSPSLDTLEVFVRGIADNVNALDNGEEIG